MDMQGFFVRVDGPELSVAYKGPYESLGSARNEAKRLGPGLNIYHGFLKFDGISYDDKELDFIENC